MKIKTKLTLLFTIISGAILFLFALFVYLSAASDRRSEFYNTLRKEAMTRANVLLDAEIDPEILQTIYRQNREVLSEVEVAIYDPQFNLLYHDAEDIDFVKETPEMINEIVEIGEIRFVQKGWEVIGLLFYYSDTPFVITAAAFDEYGHTKLSNLRNTMLILWLISVVIIFFAGRFFAFRALKPVADMVDKADEIGATNLGLRLPEGKGKDELAELAQTFNRMLDRLENSFDAQKEFVSNVSHELRTPLAAIIGEIELTLSQPRENESYRTSMEKLLSDANRLARITTGLLDLAKASYDPTKVSLKEVRIDEILLDARLDLLKTNPDYKIDLIFDDQADDDELVTRKGNEYLLKVAVSNIMENACKFSDDKKVKVVMEVKDQSLLIRFQDHGAGIPEEDIHNVFKPFYRGKNKHLKEGSGIGLPLVQRIAELHGADITIHSRDGEGTEVLLKWERVYLV